MSSERADHTLDNVEREECQTDGKDYFNNNMYVCWPQLLAAYNVIHVWRTPFFELALRMITVSTLTCGYLFENFLLEKMNTIDVT